MKRNLFEELSEGFDALEKEHEGKITLRSHQLKQQPAPTDSSGTGDKGTAQASGSAAEKSRLARESP